MTNGMTIGNDWALDITPHHGALSALLLSTNWSGTIDAGLGWGLTPNRAVLAAWDNLTAIRLDNVCK